MTLGLGIGANTAIFSVVHGVLLRPLPYPQPRQLITVWEDHSRRDGPETEWTGASTFLDWRADNRSFQELAAYTGWGPNLVGDGDPEQLSGLTVSAGWFRVLGVAPRRGRGFDDRDEAVDTERVAVLSHALWQRRFGGDPEIVGRAVELDDRAFTVVGVMPDDFQPLFAGTEIWRPIRFDPTQEDRGNYFLRVVGRLRDGIDPEATQRDMDRVGAQVTERAPKLYRDIGITLIPLHERLTGATRPAVLALSGAVALLLLVACANVANLLLVEAVGRGHEMAVRASLGADRGRLIRQLTGESLALAALGGGLGLGLGAWGVRILVAMAPAGTPRIHDVGLHPAVVAFAVVLTLLTGFAFGLLPAWSGARVDLAGVLRPGTRVEGRHQGRLRAALVVAETALALCLLVGSGLLMKSFQGLLEVDLGFRPEGVVTTNLALSAERYPERVDRVAFYDRLIAALVARPEIEAAAATSIVPMLGNGTDTTYYVEGTPPAPVGERPAAWYRMITLDYFDTLGITLLGGRPFNGHDTLEAPGVVAVSERFARRWFGDGEAVGRRMKFGGHDSEREWRTIIAVVRDVRDRSPMLPHRDDIYLPHAQFGSRAMTLTVTGRGGVEAVMPALRAEVRRLDPALPLTPATALTDLVADSLWLPRLAGQVLTFFALAALLLAAIGLYGVLSHAVEARRRELGIRQALGADRRSLLQLILGHGLRLAAAGLVVGLGLAVALAGALESLLHDVDARDPATLGVTAGVLLLTAALASWLPAWRAARSDPAICLHDE